MLLPYDVLNRLVCKLLAIGSQTANISTHEAEGLRLFGSWVCCLSDPCAIGRVVLQLVMGPVVYAMGSAVCVFWRCAVGLFGGEMVNGADDFRTSALDTRIAKSLVVVSGTFLTRCMVVK